MQYKSFLTGPALALTMLASGCARDRTLVDQKYVRIGPHAFVAEYSDKRGIEVQLENSGISVFDFNRDGIADSASTTDTFLGVLHVFSSAELDKFQDVYRDIYDDYMRQKQADKK